MTDKFTPAMALAAASLLENRGLAPARQLIELIDEFNNSVIVTACQEKFTSNSTSASVKSAIGSLPYSLTGIVPRSMSSDVSDDIKNQFYFNNLILDVKKQTELLTSHKLKGLAEILSQVNQFCTTSFYLKGFLDEVKVARFQDFGFSINNYKDEVTGGINSQFSHLEGGVFHESFDILFNQISNFGTLFDIKNLSGLDDPRVLYGNLIDQGFTKLRSYLEKYNIDEENIENEDTDLVLSAFKDVKGNDLKLILSATNFVSYSALSTLADVFDIEKILSPKAVIAAGGSLESLKNKLINIGGDFTSFDDLRDTYLSLEKPELPSLNTFTDLTGNLIINAENEQLGYGSDVFVNPTMFDCIGVLSGEEYIDRIKFLVTLHKNLSNTSFERNLLQAIINNDADNIASLSSSIRNDNNYKSLISTGNRQFRNIFKKLTIERKNIFNAGIEVETTEANLSSIYTFIVTLANSFDELSNLRYIEFIKSITTDDVYGETILAVIAEGLNNNLLSLKNIPNYALLDPVAYSKVKIEIANCNPVEEPEEPTDPYEPIIDPNEKFIVTPECGDWEVIISTETFVVTHPVYRLPDECVVWNVRYSGDDCFTVTFDHLYDNYCVIGGTFGEGVQPQECFTLSAYPSQVQSSWVVQKPADQSVIITTGSPLPQGTVGQPYSQTLSSINGVAPYTYELISGSLPGNLSLTSSGAIQGSPITTGNSTFTVRSSATSGATPGTKEFNLQIIAPAPAPAPIPAPVPTPLCLTIYQDTEVTGSLSGGQVWGIGPLYKEDSTLAMAVVHAGLVAPGEKVLVRRTAQFANSYQGITRNGVTSLPYAQGQCGYIVEKVPGQTFEFAADYILLQTLFIDGRDLDIRVGLVYPDGIGTDYLGWARRPTEGNYMTWGTDNTGRGFEAVLFNVNAFKAAHPGVNEIKIDFRCFWYSQKGTSPVSISMTLWKGGTPTFGNYTWTNSTATDVENLASAGKVITAATQSPSTSGERLAVLTYNLVTGFGSIDINDTTNFDFP